MLKYSFVVSESTSSASAQARLVPAAACMSVVAYMLAALFFMAMSSLALASPVYKSVDANGKVTYSDAPTGKKIEPVDLPLINQTPSVSPQPYTPSQGNGPMEATFLVNITSPAQGAYVPPGQRDLTVSASISPALSAGYVARLMHNGAPSGPPQASSTFTLLNIARGAHALRVVIFSPEGRAVASSPTVTVNVIRATVN